METEAKEMRSFHGDPAIKQKYIDRVKHHQKLDNIIQGTYWENGRGCAVGCTLEKGLSPHDRYPVELGLPTWLAHLEDHLFENLHIKEAKTLPLAFLEAIPVGIKESEFHLVNTRFKIFWLERQKRQAGDIYADPKVEEAIDRVIELLTLSINGCDFSHETWYDLKSRIRNKIDMMSDHSWSQKVALRAALYAAHDIGSDSMMQVVRQSVAITAARTNGVGFINAADLQTSSTKEAVESEAIVKRDCLLNGLRALGT